jgi:hypothetical protein
MTTTSSTPVPPQAQEPPAWHVARQSLEVVVVAAVAGLIHTAFSNGLLSAGGVCVVVAIVACLKAGYFMIENLQHILLATRQEMPYHRFLVLMGVNMAQITLSFALDFWLLETAEPGSFTGFDTSAGPGMVFFDCCFFSVLNFSFFGFGEIMPRTVPSKIVTLLEVVLAFFTVIFLLSDFVSLKQSLRGSRRS